jgi:hypothetical protein
LTFKINSPRTSGKLICPLNSIYLTKNGCATTSIFAVNIIIILKRANCPYGQWFWAQASPAQGRDKQRPYEIFDQSFVSFFFCHFSFIFSMAPPPQLQTGQQSAEK